MTSTKEPFRIPWRPFFAEMAGTAVLLLLGLSIVIYMFGKGSPMAELIPSEGARRALTGFLFGSIGASVALSKVGKESGAHINPAVTLAFWLVGKLDLKVAIVYIVGQLSGAVLGSLPLLAWGEMGRSVNYGVTIPGDGYEVRAVLVGEALTTFGLVFMLCLFLGFRQLRPFTPFMIPPLYTFMSWAEAPISGTSTNPARTLGPALIAGRWEGWWIYWVGPILGMLAALAVANRLTKRIEVAKLYYFETDTSGVFRRRVRAA